VRRTLLKEPQKNKTDLKFFAFVKMRIISDIFEPPDLYKGSTEIKEKDFDSF